MNNISAIQDKAFHNLKNLDALDLSNNNLRLIPSFETFSMIGQLRELDLSGNPIGPMLRTHVFKALRHLVRLELKDCKLQFIQSKAFSGLEALEWLILDDNELNILQPSSMLPIQKSLHGLGLQGNPWNCTCKLLRFRQWMIEHNIPSNAMPPACSQPTRLRGKTWNKIEVAEFACPPRIVHAGEWSVL